MKEFKENPAYNRQESEPMYEYIDAEYFNRDRKEPEPEARGCGACAERLGCLGYTLHKVEVNMELTGTVSPFHDMWVQENLFHEFKR